MGGGAFMGFVTHSFTIISSATRAKVAHVQECLRVIDAKKKELQDTVTGKDSKVYQTLLQKYTHEAEVFFCVISSYTY